MGLIFISNTQGFFLSLKEGAYFKTFQKFTLSSFAKYIKVPKYEIHDCLYNEIIYMELQFFKVQNISLVYTLAIYFLYLLNHGMDF